jgi:tetratricopeptide (TPR) repeat protein
MQFQFNGQRLFSCTTLILMGVAGLAPVQAQTLLPTVTTPIGATAPQLSRTTQRVLLRQCPLRWPSTQNDATTIQSLQQQLQAFQKAGNKGSAGAILNQLSDIYRVLGRYDEALKAAQQSIDFAKVIDAPGLEAASLGSLVHIYVELGQYAPASVAAERSQQLRQGSSLEALSLNNLGIVKTLQGQFTVANGHYLAGLALGSNASISGWIRANQGNIAYLTQGADRAIARYDQALVPKSDPPNYGALMNNRGLVYQAQGKFDLALQSYDMALQAFVPSNNTSCQWKTLSNRGRLLAQQGQTTAAIGSYQQAVAITTKIWQDSVAKLSPEQRKSYRQIIRPIYQELANLWANQGEFAKADAVFTDLEIRRGPVGITSLRINQD